MLVCDKHRIGTPRVARYELVLRDLMAEKPEASKARYGQEYGKTNVFPVKKELCAECGDKLLAIINAFIEALKPEDFFDQLKDDFLEQTQQILAEKAEAIEKQKDPSLGGYRVVKNVLGKEVQIAR